MASAAAVLMAKEQARRSSREYGLVETHWFDNTREAALRVESSAARTALAPPAPQCLMRQRWLQNSAPRRAERDVERIGLPHLGQRLLPNSSGCLLWNICEIYHFMGSGVNQD